MIFIYLTPSSKMVDLLFIKIQHLVVIFSSLQNTLIGKTVNKFKKYDDPIGKIASRIVDKWKKAVAETVPTSSAQTSSKNTIGTVMI